MKVESKVNIHNRFDIEVRDAITGELKQEAHAFNIVLNAMWTRLCAGLTYFVNIQFGTGTGTLSPTRTALFTYLGYKTAVDDTLVKAIPNSSWKRKIVLNPEEFVGAALTEVGIAYSTGSTLVTHAMLKDAEGNPISITKTHTDIITIYATVFVTFGPDSDDFKLVKATYGNTLVNYLVGGGTAPADTFRLGSGDSVGSALALGLESTDLGATATATWTADTANKKRTTGLMRFGTTVANGHVKEFGMPSVFRARLPLSGVFAGQSYAGVPIATGDGVTREFILPSLNFKQDSITMKLNGVANSALVKTLFSNAINHRLANPSLLPANQGNCVAYSADGLIMAVGFYTSPFLRTYDLRGGNWIARPNPAELIVEYTGQGIALSADGLVLALVYDSYPYVISYDWTNGAWIKRPAPASTPNNSSSGVALSADGLIMAVGCLMTPYIRTYDWVVDAWIARPNPASLPSAAVNDIAFSADNLIMVVAHNTSPYVTTYDLVGGAWIKRANPASLPTGHGYGIALSSDGLIMAVAHVTSPFITTYDWVAGAWIKRTNPAELPILSGYSVALSADGLIMAVGCQGTPYIFIYDWVAGAWIKRTNPASLPTGGSVGTALTPDGSMVAVVQISSPFVTTYDLKKRQTKVVFDTAPAAGVAITADYTVDGVHKTDQFVIDVGFSIQFGEPT